MIPSLIFGDIFRYNDKEYIFFVKIDDIIYAAEILDLKDSKKIDGLYQKKVAAGRDSRIESMPIFCYVILCTEQLKERLASMTRPGLDDFGLVFDKLPITLNKEDLQELKREITRKTAPLAQELKEYVAKVDLG